MMNFSCILPTRGRIGLLKECIHSFFEKAENPELIEFWLACDIDDASTLQIDEFIIETGYDVKYIKVPRATFFHKNYHNRLVKLCAGDYIVGLNDECEIVQENWDRIVKNEIENFLAFKPDRIAYVYLNDSTHIPGSMGYNRGCCFPIMTKEAILAMGCYIPDEISGWGGDTSLFSIFSKLANSRILRIEDKIQILHKSHHIFLREKDEIAKRVEFISRHFLSPEKENYYAKKIEEAIDDGKIGEIEEYYLKNEFQVVNLAHFATTSTKKPFMLGEDFEIITFDFFGIKKYNNIPFKICKYTQKNAIVLKGPKGYCEKYPKNISIPCNKKINKIHLLGLTAGWGYQDNWTIGCNNDKTISFTIKAADMSFDFINGEQIADFYNKTTEVPGSILVDRSLEGNPIRYTSIEINKFVENVDLIKIDNSTCPIILGITFEL